MTRRVTGLGLYTLLGRLSVPCDDMDAWCRFMETPDARRVALDYVGPMKISTVFLAIDHSFGFGGNPLLFETMIFGIEDDNYQRRSETWDEAEAMHKKAIEIVTMMLDMAEVTIKAFERLLSQHKAL